MSIGNCDCCDRLNVPGSVVDCPGEPFACHICQGDTDPDPYCELELQGPPDPRGPFFVTAWEREDHDRHKRGKPEMGPRGI